MRIFVYRAFSFLLLLATAAAAQTAATAAELGGGKYNCLGGLRAGTDDGVAPFTGKWQNGWPGLTHKQGYTPGPYADEKPLLTITSDNMSQYADQLTAGEKALLEKYPHEFHMLVYPSHRDFRMPDYICQAAEYNAAHAKLASSGLAITGHGGAPPFPLPNTGLKAIWNVIHAVTVWSEEVTYDIADVFRNGEISWGRVHFKQMTPDSNPDASQRNNFSDKVNSYFLQAYILPARSKGLVGVGYVPNSFANGSTTQAWIYLPGVRRLRKAPDVGFDYPIPPEGMRTSDSDYVFNGSPERYDWKLVGRKAMYVPYNNFRINDPALSYKQLLGKHTLNPQYVRFELHRAWIIEGTLKPGMRHIFKKRVIYADEDTWLALTADNYDMQGQLFRIPMVLYNYAPAAGTYHRSVSAYYSLPGQSYEATYLVNERPADQWWRINIPMTTQDFNTSAAIREAQ